MPHAPGMRNPADISARVAVTAEVDAPYRPDGPPSLENMLAGRGLQLAASCSSSSERHFFSTLRPPAVGSDRPNASYSGLPPARGSFCLQFVAFRTRIVCLPNPSSALGAGILYLSPWASVAVFPELHISRTAAFVAMIAVAATLAALAAMRRSERIAFLGALGGYVTPLLLNSGQPNQVLLAAYVILLTGGLLVRRLRCVYARCPNSNPNYRNTN